MNNVISGRDMLLRILQRFEDARSTPAPTPEAALADPNARRALQILCEDQPGTIAAYRAIYEPGYSKFDSVFQTLARSGLLTYIAEDTPYLRATSLGREHHARITQTRLSA